jgi:hypothetical protein
MAPGDISGNCQMPVGCIGRCCPLHDCVMIDLLLQPKTASFRNRSKEKKESCCKTASSPVNCDLLESLFSRPRNFNLATLAAAAAVDIDVCCYIQCRTLTNRNTTYTSTCVLLMASTFSSYFSSRRTRMLRIKQQ